MFSVTLGSSGARYRLNRILKERLAAAVTVASRLDRIARELARVKKTLAT